MTEDKIEISRLKRTVEMKDDLIDSYALSNKRLREKIVQRDGAVGTFRGYLTDAEEKIRALEEKLEERTKRLTQALDEKSAAQIETEDCKEHIVKLKDQIQGRLGDNFRGPSDK